ncbi:MAG: hypothetical protein M3Q33_14520 [Acidobacteriota bacterium]|nr:hypothetical protein [Acidobacteriota bacterium]
MFEKSVSNASDFFRDGGIVAQGEKASNESFGKKRRKFDENRFWRYDVRQNDKFKFGKPHG